MGEGRGKEGRQDRGDLGPYKHLGYRALGNYWGRTRVLGSGLGLSGWQWPSNSGEARWQDVMGHCRSQG